MLLNADQPVRIYRLFNSRTGEYSKIVKLTTEEATIFNRAYACNGLSLRYVPVQL